MTENEDTNFVSHGHARATSRDPTRHFRAILARALASVDPSNSFLCESIIKKTLLERRKMCIFASYHVTDPRKPILLTELRNLKPM